MTYNKNNIAVTRGLFSGEILGIDNFERQRYIISEKMGNLKGKCARNDYIAMVVINWIIITTFFMIINVKLHSIYNIIV